MGRIGALLATQGTFSADAGRSGRGFALACRASGDGLGRAALAPGGHVSVLALGLRSGRGSQRGHLREDRLHRLVLGLEVFLDLE